MPELKPCPFCGDIDGIEIEPYIDSYGKQDGYEISCQSIYCVFQPTGWSVSKECAIEVWNERSTK